MSTACASCHTGDRIHSSGIIGTMQARALTAEEIADQVTEEHEALVNELSETEKRTETILLMMYAGAGGLVVVIMVVVLMNMRQKRG